MKNLIIPGDAPDWAHHLVKQIEQAQRRPRVLKSFSKDTLPSTATVGELIRVPDATAGEAIAMWDGTQWLEFQNAGAVS